MSQGVHLKGAEGIGGLGSNGCARWSGRWKVGFAGWSGRWKQAACLCFFLAAMLGMSEEARAQAIPTPEYQVKAVFLYQFTHFVEWPDGAFPGPQSPLVICVLGEDPFGAYLEEAVRGEVVNGRALVVQRYLRAEETEPCHLVFVSSSEAPRLERILSNLRTRPLLTVGDVAEFAHEGGIIQFVTERGRVRLRINAEAARSANLTISSKLLSLADIVTASALRY